MKNAGATNILVLAHDLSDAAIQRRIAMLQAGGANVTAAGFRRTSQPVNIPNCKTIDLGRTYGAQFAQRILSVLFIILRIGRFETLFADADIIIARNLEMLAIGVRGRSLCKPKPVLFYECLDIHRLLLSEGVTGEALRRLEGWLCKRASALITSSPAFVDNYFKPLSNVQLPIKIIENKNLNLADVPPPQVTHTAGPPWKIGWFGIIRCRQSLQILTNLVNENSSAIEVIIRGIPALDQFDDFHKQIAAVSGIKFMGPYKNPDDLADMYQEVQFVWAIDMFEEGKNSSWLLPNRLYEGGFYNSIPLAQATVETGHFLKRNNIGVTLNEPPGRTLKQFFKDLSPEKYKALADNLRAAPATLWTCNQADCVELVNYLQGLKHP